jgi:hypothetical protein
VQSFCKGIAVAGDFLNLVSNNALTVKGDVMPQVGAKSPPNAALAKIPVLSQQFNKLVDEASTTVRQVEEFFEKSHLGSVGASVLIGTSGSQSYSLTYRKIGDKFRIAIDNGDDDPTCPPEYSESTKAFSDCTRDLKLSAFQKLPELIEQVAGKLEVLISQTKATTKAVQDTIGLFPKLEE